MSEMSKHFDTGLKIATTLALISVALLGTKFVTKEEFTAANSRIEKIEAVLIRMEQNAITDARRPLPIHYHTLSDQLLSKFPYSKNFAPLKFAFRYVHWANGEIFEGPMSNTYKIWYQTFPFRQNHYYSSILGGAVSETVSAPNHFLKCALA